MAQKYTAAVFEVLHYHFKFINLDAKRAVYNCSFAFA